MKLQCTKQSNAIGSSPEQSTEHARNLESSDISSKMLRCFAG